MTEPHKSSAPHGDDRRWLDDSRNVTRVVYALGTLCAVMFLADLFYTKKAHFDIEEIFGFYAVYGFLGSVGLVLAAKAMRPLLRRDEDYYERDHVRPHDAGPADGGHHDV